MVQNPNNQDLMPKFEKELQDKTSHDISATFNTNQTYQNKTGKEKILEVQVNLVTPTIDDSSTVFGFSNTNPDPTLENTNQVFGLNAGAVRDENFTLVLIIPPNYYYHVKEVLGGMGSLNLGNVFEWY